jgi:magnesium chelatase subunit D
MTSPLDPGRTPKPSALCEDNSTLCQLQYPFAAIVGMEAAKRALMLLAVDQGLTGALIGLGSGSAKTSLARSYAALLTEPGSFIHIPLNITIDRLLGGIDIERTLETGSKHDAKGLLAQADGGMVFVDDINLLDTTLANHIASALESGVVRVEREGLSEEYRSRFRLVGTYNPAEGDLDLHFKDRVGLISDSPLENSVEAIAEMLSRVLRFERDPDGFVEEFAVETAALKFAIASARIRLSEIRVASKDIRLIVEASAALGVEGNRADVFAVRAARANAALDGRSQIIDEDIITAIKLVLLPRATTAPQLEERREETADSIESENESLESGNTTESDAGDSPDSHGGPDRTVEDLIIEALDAPAPDDALTVAHAKAGRGVSGKRLKATDRAGGKYVGSYQRRDSNTRIAVDATLRAAAPYQLARRLKKIETALDAGKDKNVHITYGDLRFKRFKRKTGTLFIFAVDASGSMSLNRMAQAKGALARLLQQAYLHRDKVALIRFRRSTAEALLAPTRSVELAKRLVDSMPTGGATPMAAALVEALNLARRARFQGIPQAMLLLFTDGRANRGLADESSDKSLKNSESISEELRGIGKLLERESVRTVVIDTRPRFVATGEGRALAELIGGRYLYLPRADTTAIYEAVKAVSSETEYGD